MKQFTQEVFGAWRNSDLTEGKGYDILIGYFLKQEDAQRAAHKAGVMGADGTVKQEQLRVVVFENFGEYENERKADARKRALAKLTQEERILLGLELEPAPANTACPPSVTISQTGATRRRTVS